MSSGENDSQGPKISAQFLTRLGGLEPQQKIRAIVMLAAVGPDRPAGRRMTRQERKAAIQASRKSAGEGLGEIDEILDRFDGRRLSKSVDALGCVPVETTAAGINALATCERVRTIVEDQRIGPLPKPKRRGQ